MARPSGDERDDVDSHHWMDMAEEAGQLQEAMMSRARIEQAKGVLAVLRGTDPESAFAELRKTSMDGNVKLHALAEALVALVSVGEAEDGRPMDTASRLAHRTWAADLSAVRGALRHRVLAVEERARP